MTQRRRPASSARTAREYAEGVYQALRRWETHQSDPESYSSGSSRSSRFQVVGVGNWRSGQGGGTSSATVSLLVLPGGNVPEGRVGLIIIDLLHGDRQARVYADLLARIRSGHSPVSLLDERGGWRSERARSVFYGLAVTELMRRLGNDSAAEHLATLQELQESKN